MTRRLVIFVRHGEYEAEPEELTGRGREQVRLTGERLAAGPAIDRIVPSTMPRAVQTAELLAPVLGVSDLVPDGDLAESVPDVPAEHLLTAAQLASLTRYAADGSGARQLAAAAARYLVPSEVDTVDLLVCHANVIRWLVCAAINAGPDAWFQLAHYHCALSAVVLRPGRPPAAIAVNDATHLPPELRGLDHGDELTWPM